MTQPTLFDRVNPEPCREPLSAYSAYASEQAQEQARWESAADRVLARLQQGPATNLELITICQRISGRIYDLRRRGHIIAVDALQPGVYRYTLTPE